MTDNKNDETIDATASAESTPKTTKKKVTRKKTTKKSTKKTAKKVAKAPTEKKTAAKKTTKKTTKKKVAKKTTKKTPAKAEAAPDEPVATEPVGGDQTKPAESSEDAPQKTRRRSSKKTSKVAAPKKPDTPRPRSKKEEPRPYTEMIVNYVPGEDCRIAMVEDGQLEEVFSEHTSKVSRVNNIYVGRVTNVEASIQAAFIDFGTEFNGFLHISDIHPQYFAKGDDKTERVGKKTPHRERPPIQNCLKKGQEIIVQVLKEGVGTKGPSLTSYLSIPGRFLVMMPGMDKVGVSRKEEDDDKRKAAKKVLSTLDLPEGFGFILRTAGFDRTKAELKRDLAYLNRLWSDMEKRRKKGNRPRLLYSESDLLVRSIRDMLSSDIDRVIIDSEAALKRVARFVKIAAPRSHAKLAHYTGSTPIFHAFDIERQIEEIHAREVHLPSGGRLVIDQTEALVAIDVNSGKSRGAKDAETNAYKTNLEAVDAICRQLRLRDLGGLVVNDMIDMRYISHRKDIEARFRERLKRDRAKSSITNISEFGLLEMTRQRMRGSMESQHFAECPTCRGRGLVQRPGSVADSALRDLSQLLNHRSVHHAELVVHSRVASELLSTRRSSLIRVELEAEKTVDVRVSDSLPIDRIALYAYEANGNDIDAEKLAKLSRPKPQVVEWTDTSKDDASWAVDPFEEGDESTVLKLAEGFAKKAEQAESADLPIDDSTPLSPEEGQPAKKKRRRRRRGKGGPDSEANTDNNSESQTKAESDPESKPSEESTPQLDENGEPIKKKRRRRRRGRGRDDSDSNTDQQQDFKTDSKPRAKTESKKPESSTEPKPATKPRRRGLYSGGRRKLTSAEITAIDRDT